MKTPPALVGTLNPKTKRPFGAEIKLGTGTSHLPEARRRRDVFLGDVRKLEDAARGNATWSVARAEGWAKEIAAYKDTTVPLISTTQSAGIISLLGIARR